MIKRIHFSNLFEKNVVNYLFKEISQRLCHSQSLNICVSGGTSLIKILKLISKKKIDWSKIRFYLTDERIVEDFSKNSNFYNTKNAFNNEQIKLYKMYNGCDVNQSIFNYNKLLKKNLKKLPEISFDLLILGYGTDGHIASIFPKEKIRYNDGYLFQTKIHNDFKRLSLNMNILKKSEKTIIISYGKKKYELLNEMFDTEMPIIKLAENNSNLNWFPNLNEL